MNISPNLPLESYSTRLIDRLVYAHDASLYRVVPEAVARPVNENDVISLLNYGNETNTPITFRAGGTSLSGQAVGPGIIAETVRDWKKWEILEICVAYNMIFHENGMGYTYPAITARLAQIQLPSMPV